MAKVTSRWAHSDEITGVAYTPDGSNIVTASEEYALHIFPQVGDKSDSTAENIITDEAVTCLVVNRTDIYTGAADGIVRQYNIRSRESVGAVGRYDLAIRCLAQSPNGAYLAVGTESNDIKMITLDDVDQCWNFKGHKKAISSFSFDPEGQFLLSSSCDGTVIVWNMKTKDPKPEHVINVMAAVLVDSPARIPVAWHPTGEFFVIGKDQNVVAYHRDTWTKSFTYVGGSTQPITCVGWSPNGKFLAASSVDSDLCVWQYKKKDSPVSRHKHNNGRITGLAWAPNANRLVFVDTKGELSRWEAVIAEGTGSPFNAPKNDPLAGLFDEEAAEETVQENEIVQEYMSEDESLHEFVVDDDNGGYLPPTRPVESHGASAGKMQPAKVLHPCFQSGSTRMRDSRRYLDFNGLGIISTVDHGGNATVSVEFHDKLSGRGYHFADNNNYSMGCLGKIGAFFAAKAADGNPATVHYKMHEYLGSKFEWQNYLPEGEDVTAITLNGESAIVATTKGYIRVFSQSGIQTGLFSVGSVIAAAGKDDLIILLYHAGEPFAGSQNLGYVVYNVETGQRIQQALLPVADDTYVTWLGFSSGGIPAFYDDNGVMHVLNYYRRVDQGQWTPILDSSLVVAESETVSTPHYWPVSLTDEAMKCVKCKRNEAEPSFPKPFLTDLPLRMPTLYQNTPAGQHEEAWLRQKILSGLNKDEKIAMSVESSDNVVARKELEMDKLAIQMIDLACQDERTQKALDLTAMLCNLRSIDAAIKIAHHYNLHSLMERMNKVREIKRIAEEERDPEAEMAMIMADPEVAVRPARDNSTFKVSSREEDEELERRSIQRRAPVQANDPFGRRVVKDSKPAKSNNNSGGSSSTGVANPFKKSSGVAGAGPRGFGNVVKESDRHGGGLPITRRATDVFEAAEMLSADEQRARAEKERQSSKQDDLLRKRKANGSGPANGSGSGGQQTVHQLFGKSAVTSAADPKRFKKAGEETLAEPEDDAMMDADDFLEPQEDEDAFEESQPSAAQRIPDTQEYEESLAQYGGDESLDDTIEETRGHFEKTRVAASPVSGKNAAGSSSTSSVLAGFKFNKS
ncbi:hypothetical protein BGZ74_009205 [Mortierella antarctica]|nr:hypothetical protein BGZ74_009205 [Mortierella antarctica]